MEEVGAADILDNPLSISGEKVLAPRGATHVYQVANTSRGQITKLACIGAAGDVLSPMVIFPGQRFHYDPLEGFPEAYLGRSDNGWMDTEPFYISLKDHFLPHVSDKNVQRPILLLVYGHSTHCSLKNCAQRIILFCTHFWPMPHTFYNHARDKGFFAQMKTQWKHEIRKFQFDHPGETVTKKTFPSVLKGVWDVVAKPEYAISAFVQTGIFPFRHSRPDKRETQPSSVYGNASPAAAPLPVSSQSVSDSSATTIHEQCA